MTRSLLISPCSQLLTLAGSSRPRRGKEQADLGIIADGAVLIKESGIAWVGPAHQFDPGRVDGPVQQIAAERCVVMPGFVDSHAHPVFLHSRDRDYELRILGKNYREIAAMGGGILSTVRSVRTATLPQLVEASKPRLTSFLEHGTTTLEAKSGYGLNQENEIKMLEAINRLQESTPLELIPTFLGAHEVPEEYRSNRTDYLRLLVEEMIPAVSRRGLAEFCDCFVEPGIFEVDEAEKILLAAQRCRMKLKLHADQFSRSGATLLGIRLKAVSVDHLEQIAEEDIIALSRADSVATLLPGSIFHLGLKGYPPARALIETRVPVALATDFNPGTSPTVNMQMILSLACTQMRMTPAEAIVAATINGAHALDRADRLGSLEPGKQADICIMDVEDYRQIPYWFGTNHCRMTIKKGSIVYQRDS